MQLSIGQTVVHPNHGVGTITNITKLDFLEEFNRYYVINFLANNLTSQIPIRKVDDSGLRKTMSIDKVGKVFNTLRDMPQGLPSNYKNRRQKLETLVNSGNPIHIAKAVRELTWRKKSENLSTSDNQMLAKGRKMLIEEIAMVTESEESETRRRVDLALSQAIEIKQADDEG